MNNVFAWMAAMGVHLDDHQPDDRLLEHIAATRRAKEQNRKASSLMTRMARAVGLLPSAHVTTGPTTSCCPA